MKLTTTFFLLTMFLLLLPDATLSEAKTNYSIHNFTTKYTDKLVKNRSVIEDKRGIVYIGNNNGVLEYDGVTWRLIKLPDSKQVYSLGIDTSGRIYVGGNSEFGYLSSDHDGRLHYQSLLSTISEKDRTFKDNINEICFSSKEIYFIADKLLFIVNRNDTLKNAKVVKASDFFYSSVCIDDQLFISDGEAGLMKLISGSLKPVADGGTILSYVMLPFNKKKVLIITPDKGAFLYDFHSIVKDKSAFTPFPLSDVITTFDIKSGVVINDSLYALGSVRNGCSIIGSAESFV